MTIPTDGYGIYDGVLSGRGNNPNGWNMRLQAIAQAGFKVVINYSLLAGHIDDVLAYINYAASVGLKVAVALNDPRIWRDGTYPSIYPELYADSGNAATGTAFMQYIVGQTKNLAGVWGWYVADELANSDHAVWQPYGAAVHTADSTHPRLGIFDCFSTNGVGTGTNLFYDGCDVWGDDCYPIGHVPTIVVGTEAANVQTQANLRSVQSAIVLQAHNLANYGLPTGVWPTGAQMAQARNDALANMSPRLILWYSYQDMLRANTPFSQWPNLVNALQGIPDGYTADEAYPDYPEMFQYVSSRLIQMKRKDI